MGAPSITYEKQAKAYPRKVFYTGSDALLKGMGVCFQRSYGTASDDDAYRDVYVRRPTTSDGLNFAGVTARSYTAKTGGRWIEIFEPGSVCYVLTNSNTTANSGLLTCMAGSGTGGSGNNGWFTTGIIPGRGSAVPLRTFTAQKEVLTTGATAALDDSTKKTLTDSAATFTTNSVAAGDRVHLLGGEDDAANTTTEGNYGVASITSETVLVLDAAATSGGTMQQTYIVTAAQPLVLCYLQTGEESGLVEYTRPEGVGSTVDTAWSIMGTGYSYICGGFTVATTNSESTLADGTYLGQPKYIKCLGTLTTNDARVLLTTTGKQAAVTDVVVTTAGDADGTPKDLVSIDFDAANEAIALRNYGVWVVDYSTGCALNAS